MSYSHIPSVSGEADHIINSALHYYPKLRAIIFPKSESALYSSQLKENESITFSARKPDRPLSPDSSSHDDTDDDEAPQSQTTQRLTQSKTVMLLGNFPEQERLTLGLSSDNDVVLRHPDSTVEKSCHINLFHAQLYPDPDYDSLVLVNRSTSTFWAHSLPNPQVHKNIRQDEEDTLKGGCWHVRFGEGLDFEVHVLPWAAREIDPDWMLISPSPMNASLPKKRSGIVAEKQPSNISKPRGEANTKRNEASSNSVATTKGIQKMDKAGQTMQASRKGGKRAMGNRESSLGQLVGQTGRTNVFTSVRRGVMIAIKMCRDPVITLSADLWKNEVKILKAINHPSVIKIFGSNASTLQLELEYGGQDLSKFVDIQRMSTLSRDTAHQIWIDIGSGIEHIHSKNILHLDIKPDNILLGQGDRAKICDFGISIQPALQPVRYAGGTPAYLPPECRRGIRVRPGGIWACGLVMMFVLGICPLPSPGKWKVANVHLGMDDTVKMGKWLDEIERYKKELPGDSLLLKMLSIEQRKRITSSELVKGLRELSQVAAVN